MKDAFRVDTWRRERGRDLRPLRRLIPFIGAHRVDAALGIFFLVVSSAALLALTAGFRLIIDQGFMVHDRAALAHVFLVLGAGAAVLALATGLRMYFLYTLGERVVADLRQVVFRHVLGLDLTHFLTSAHRRGALADDHRHDDRRGDGG